MSEASARSSWRPPACELGHLEKVIDQRGEGAHVALGGVEITADRLRFLHHAIGQRLQNGADGCQRCLQVVADPGDQVGAQAFELALLWSNNFQRAAIWLNEAARAATSSLPLTGTRVSNSPSASRSAAAFKQVQSVGDRVGSKIAQHHGPCRWRRSTVRWPAANGADWRTVICAENQTFTKVSRLERAYPPSRVQRMDNERVSQPRRYAP